MAATLMEGPPLAGRIRAEVAEDVLARQLRQGGAAVDVPAGDRDALGVGVLDRRVAERTGARGGPGWIAMRSFAAFRGS